MMNSNCKCGCVLAQTAKVLVLVGALNWGLVGVGMFMGKNLNLVNAIFSSMSSVEAIVYVLVGVAAVVKIVGCRCAKCKAACASCSTCQTGTN